MDSRVRYFPCQLRKPFQEVYSFALRFFLTHPDQSSEFDLHYLVENSSTLEIILEHMMVLFYTILHGYGAITDLDSNLAQSLDIVKAIYLGGDEMR